VARLLYQIMQRSENEISERCSVYLVAPALLLFGSLFDLLDHPLGRSDWRKPLARAAFLEKFSFDVTPTPKICRSITAGNAREFCEKSMRMVGHPAGRRPERCASARGPHLGDVS
jgi:hypothetical protein